MSGNFSQSETQTSCGFLKGISSLHASQVLGVFCGRERWLCMEIIRSLLSDESKLEDVEMKQDLTT